jgi:hypothetical protein
VSTVSTVSRIFDFLVELQKLGGLRPSEANKGVAQLIKAHPLDASLRAVICNTVDEFICEIA